MPKPLSPPGVRLDELTDFSLPIAPVPTAIPGFIGYTPRATYQDKSYINQPVPIGSFAEFQQYFALLDPATQQPRPDHAQSAPVYYPLPARQPDQADLVLGGVPYDLAPDRGTLYHLYHSIKLFYLNGGDRCYVVSVGTYGAPAGAGTPKGTRPVNPNVTLAALTGGLAALGTVAEVTLTVLPDAVLLADADFASLGQQVLADCGRRQSRFALFDIPGGDAPSPTTWMADDITPFRTAVGTQFLDYGAAYYPFVCTALVGAADVDFTNVGGGTGTLARILPQADQPPLQSLLAAAGQAGPDAPTPAQIEQGLRAASPDYDRLQTALLARLNILPPSGAMAGLYRTVDQSRGVWSAPANISPVGVVDVTLRLTQAQQSDLNTDAASGKSINALRLFVGKGVLVWGARTLDGNSPDWRYLNVRRTAIYLEQSIRQALRALAFAPNDARTWAAVTRMIESFLTGVWRQGGLFGAKPTDAFSVRCGLGLTMTSEDLLNGFLNVSVWVALTHPAEFIVLTFQQQQAVSA